MVIDCGSMTSMAGFAGDASPSSVFPSVCRDNWGYSPYGPKLSHPIQGGIVVNWDGMEKIWHQVFYEKLRVAPEEHPVMLSEAPLNPKPVREKMTQTMFETFNTPAMYVAKKPVLALLASGRTTGIVLDVGETESHAVPIYEGHALPHAITSRALGGSDLTDYLTRLVAVEHGWRLTTTSSEIEIARDLKETLCFVALDFEQMQIPPTYRNDPWEKHYENQGRGIWVRDVRFRCPEALFQPSLVGKGPEEGIHVLLHNSIGRCDVDIRNDLYDNIVLFGGSTMFDGFANRVQKELMLAPVTPPKVKIFAPPDRRSSAWIGGSILASQPRFPQMTITKEEYDESGASVVSKCF